MCGIAGYYRSNKFHDASWINEMNNMQAHRGPDDDGTFVDDRILLGHRRLSIIDLSSNAKQPIHSISDRYVMVFNGEIYNFRELVKKHNIAGNTQSDTVLLIELYEKLGSDFIHELNGMFAMAIFDKVDGSLQLWRDRLGIKPLYYYFDGVNFAFSSELKALCVLPIEKKINNEAIQDYLFVESIPEPLTIYNNCYKLEKGHSLKIINGQLDKVCYYDILNQINPHKSSKSENEYLEEFDELLHRSIKRRMVSDVQVGAYLSGGVDSSAVCAAYQSNSEEPVQTFTIGFNEDKYDESRYAEKVANQLNCHHKTFQLNQSKALEIMYNSFDHFDEPFAVSSVLPMFKLSEMASKDVKVVLSGDGGDELFMGYGYYNWQKRLESIRKYSGKAGILAAKNLLKYAGGTYSRTSRMFEETDAERQWLHLWSQDQFMFGENEVSQLTNSPYQNQTLFNDWKSINQLDIPSFDKISLFDIRHYLANNLLQKVDITTMSSGLEARVPLLDHEIVEFAINLPVKMKINNGKSKYLLKKWLSRHISQDLIDRKKWGFPAPINVWLNEEFKVLIDQYLSADAVEKTGQFDYSFVDKLVKDFKSGKNHHFKRIWALICFQMWYEKQM